MERITKTVVNFILDCSGSMESVKEATISGFNEYIQTLKADKKANYSFTLTLFDTTNFKPFKAVSIDKVAPLTTKSYVPSGATALYDAVCATIKEVVEEPDQKVLTIVMTDGEENSSKEYSEAEMAALIKEREAKGNWSFVFLGANQDSYAKAAKYGISQLNTSNYHSSTLGTQAAMRSIAQNTVAYSASTENQTNAFFSKEDQENLESTK